MEYQQGQDREQLSLYATCLDDMIPGENSVRLIDQFVNLLDLSKMGFQTIATQGRPPYHPADLLKLFIYGYMNRMRSSRRLEKECHRNIEVIWLIKNLKPDHNTIARFRKENPKAIRKVFRQSVAIARNFNLIGGNLIAGDSTKLRAQNSKKNNYNKKKIKRHLEYIDKKLEEHNQQLATADVKASLFFIQFKNQLFLSYEEKQIYRSTNNCNASTVRIGNEGYRHLPRQRNYHGGVL